MRKTFRRCFAATSASRRLAMQMRIPNVQRFLMDTAQDYQLMAEIRLGARWPRKRKLEEIARFAD